MAMGWEKADICRAMVMWERGEEERGTMHAVLTSCRKERRRHAWHGWRKVTLSLSRQAGMGGEEASKVEGEGGGKGRGSILYKYIM